MNKLKYLLITILFLVLFIPFNTKADENKIRLYLFHQNGCPHCEAEIEFLQQKGYTIVYEDMAYIGVKQVETVVAELTAVTSSSRTAVEQQKIKLLEEILPVKKVFDYGDLVPIRIELFENLGDESDIYYNDKVVYVDKKYLEKADFVTLYTEIQSYMNKSAGSAADWGYAMTDMIGEQLRLSTDPVFRAKFNAVKAKYEALGNE